MDVRAKIEQEAYQPTLPYPEKPAIPPILRKQVGNLLDAEIPLVATARADYQAATARFEADRKEYNKEETQRLQQFQEDLAEEYGLTGHPKEPLLFQHAWDLGHSAGLAEVAHYYDELSDLLK